MPTTCDSGEEEKTFKKKMGSLKAYGGGGGQD